MSGQNITFFEVKGFCMWPFLRAGQKILIKKIAGSEFNPGDLMLYHADGQLLCHRLLRKEKKNGSWVFYCRPDTSGPGGEPVSENMVEGKVAAVVSANKIVGLETPWARFRAVMILFFLSPILAHFNRLYKKIKILKILKNNYLLIFILLCAAMVRIWGIGFGLPNTNCRPDEEQIVDIVKSPLHNFNPEAFNYPSLYKYINFCFYGLYFIFGLFTGKYRLLSDFVREVVVTNYKDLYLINRFLSASFGVATVFMCYKAAERFFDRKTAIISAFFLSFAYLHVRDSHFGTVDVPAVFFVMCSMLFIIKSHQDNLIKNYILSGVFAGLAASTKYIGILLIAPMLIVNSLSLSLTKGEDKALAHPLSPAKKMLFFIIFFIAAFLLGTPYAVLDFNHFISDYLGTIKRFIHGEDIILGKGWWYHLRFSLLFGMGFSLFFASLAGILVLIKINFKKAFILCSFPLVYYAIIGRGYGVFLRYAIPLVPYLCITAAVSTVYLINGLGKYLNPILNKAVMLIFPFLIILPSVYNILRFDILLSKKDNRLIAAEWINKNLPERSSIAIFDSGYGIQLAPASLGLSDKDMSRSDKIIMDYLRNNKIKGFNLDGWNGQSNMSKYIVLEESPLKRF
jgi:4-amino-4-deoxy-L-arabinose transferase-like glycosyltransferase